jgi:nitrogen fixation protein FixH
MKISPRAQLFGGRFTGWHMTAILVTFFGVVVVVNMIMARAAISTFGGTVVDNSYVASQHYNDWLAAARQQSQQHWRADATIDGGRHVVVTLSRGDASLLNAAGAAHHPLGREPDIALTFQPIGPGQLRSVQTLPAGRWQLRLVVGNDGETARIRNVVS